MEISVEKLNIQELGLDPDKTYIVNLTLKSDLPADLKHNIAKSWKSVFESAGFTKLIFNVAPELCTVTVQGVSDETAV